MLSDVKHESGLPVNKPNPGVNSSPPYVYEHKAVTWIVQEHPSASNKAIEHVSFGLRHGVCFVRMLCLLQSIYSRALMIIDVGRNYIRIRKAD